MHSIQVRVYFIYFIISFISLFLFYYFYSFYYHAYLSFLYFFRQDAHSKALLNSNWFPNLFSLL